MSLQFSLKLIDEQGIQKQILKAMHSHVSKYFTKYADYLESSVGYELSIAMEKSPTIQGLRQGGNLAGELGVEFVNIWGIIATVAHDSTKVKVEAPRLSGNEIVAKWTVTAAPSDLATIAASLHDKGIQETEKGQQLEWMKWLLTLGDAVIVRDYEVKAGFPKSSRTGDKIMVKGSGWRVPPEHAGSEGNNFITRAIDEALPEIEKQMMHLFKMGLGG
tara:strand:+ start:20984 stop:21637 length:654 start_codon:yes stop_codon:yes gene_type:complete